MDAHHFDALARTVAPVATRRALAGLVVGLLAAAGFGVGGVVRPDDASAKKRRKKIRRNAFGCVSVDGYCRRGGQCCSGICRGKKGKKRCRAHDTGGCAAGQRDVNCGGQDVPCTSATGNAGVCETSTGNAPYCASGLWVVPCATDRECRRYCGPRAACLRCGYYSAGEPTCAGPEACSNPDEL